MKQDFEEDWGESGTEKRERYWEQATSEAQNVLERQNEAVETKRESFSYFIRYHFLTLGLLFTLANFGADSSVNIGDWELVLASIPAILGIVMTAEAHRTLGSYNIGASVELFEKVSAESGSYLSAIQEIVYHYDEMIDRNREQLDRHDSLRFYNIMLFAVSMGAILGAAIS